MRLTFLNLVLRQVFQTFDRDGSGSINAREMDTVLKKLNVNLSRGQLERMMREADLNSKIQVLFKLC